jgi:ERCC4-type nuclease
MKLIVDERERDLYQALTNHVNKQEQIITSQMLPLGDILIQTEQDETVFIVERKTLADLLASVKDGRYREQSHRLKHGSGILTSRIIYLVEGYLHEYSVKEQQLIFSAMTSLNHIKGFSIMRTMTVQESASYLLFFMDKIKRETQKGMFFVSPASPATAPVTEYHEVVKSVKKDNITKENIDIIMLSQVPGISSAIAKAILQPFDSLYSFLHTLQTDSAFLDTIVIETADGKKRKLGSNIIQKIKFFFGPAPAPTYEN